MAAVGVQPADSPRTTPMTRREFLYYVWGASMALFLAEFGGAFVWFLLPRFRPGQFGGVFELDLSKIPPADSPPAEYAAGRFWLVNLGDKSVNDPRQPQDYPQTRGVKALYKVCVHLGCLYKWVPTNDRYECPCHGSKYLLSGSRIDGPARRNLDTFILQAVDANGNVLAETQPTDPPDKPATDGGAIEIPSGAVMIRVNTGKRITGSLNTKPGGGK